MNSPPPVRFPVERCRQWGGIIVGVWLLALIPFLTALALHAPARSHGLTLLIALAAFTLGAGLALRLWRRRISGALVWNGAEWLLEQAGKDGAAVTIAHPSMRLDGQCWLLLYARTGGRAAIWLWLGRSADPARWHALRCALCARIWAPLTQA